MKKHFPACYVELPPECEGRRAAFYLATEEYVADRMPADNYFLTWQVGPTVVMGRNQVALQEVNLDFCRERGIDVIRRRSGGGAIFADGNNIMTSLVSPSEAVEPLFREYAEAVAAALQRLGATVRVAGRNDIELLCPTPAPEDTTGGWRKICGNAFYKKTNRCIAHGTMLYDTDAELMERALHPEAQKLESKGVKSVRSRIGLLRDCLTLGVKELRGELRTLLCDRCVRLTDADVHRIEALEQAYYEPEYRWGSTGHADLVRRGRIEGVGTLEIHIRLQGSMVSGIALTGDYFALTDAEARMQEALTGVAFTPENIRQAILQHHPEESIRNLSPEALLNLLLDEESRENGSRE